MTRIYAEIDFVAFILELEANRARLNPFCFFVSTYCVLFRGDGTVSEQICWSPAGCVVTPSFLKTFLR
jgi:hypothetical protein